MNFRKDTDFVDLVFRCMMPTEPEPTGYQMRYTDGSFRPIFMPIEKVYARSDDYDLKIVRELLREFEGVFTAISLAYGRQTMKDHAVTLKERFAQAWAKEEYYTALIDILTGWIDYRKKQPDYLTDEGEGLREQVLDYAQLKNNAAAAVYLIRQTGSIITNYCKGDPEVYAYLEEKRMTAAVQTGQHFEYDNDFTPSTKNPKYYFEDVIYGVLSFPKGRYYLKDANGSTTADYIEIQDIFTEKTFSIDGFEWNSTYDDWYYYLFNGFYEEVKENLKDASNDQGRTSYLNRIWKRFGGFSQIDQYGEYENIRTWLHSDYSHENTLFNTLIAIDSLWTVVRSILEENAVCYPNSVIPQPSVNPSEVNNGAPEKKPQLQKSVAFFLAIFVLGRLGKVKEFPFDGTSTNEARDSVTMAAQWAIDKFGGEHNVGTLHSYLKATNVRFAKHIDTAEVFLLYHYPNEEPKIKSEFTKLRLKYEG